MISDIQAQPGLYKILSKALAASVVDAQFSTPDEGSDIVIKIYEVKHTNAPPVVKTAPNAGGSSTNVVFSAGGTMPMDRRLYIG